MMYKTTSPVLLPYSIAKSLKGYIQNCGRLEALDFKGNIMLEPVKIGAMHKYFIYALDYSVTIIIKAYLNNIPLKFEIYGHNRNEHTPQTIK